MSNVNKQGIGKFLSDELEAAERIVRGAQSAEENAESVISQGEDDYLLKEGFHSMAETGKRLVDEIWEIRHEIDEVKAAKIVEEAAEKVSEQYESYMLTSCAYTCRYVTDFCILLQPMHRKGGWNGRDGGKG